MAFQCVSHSVDTLLLSEETRQPLQVSSQLWLPVIFFGPSTERSTLLGFSCHEKTTDSGWKSDLGLGCVRCSCLAGQDVCAEGVGPARIAV